MRNLAARRGRALLLGTVVGVLAASAAASAQNGTLSPAEAPVASTAADIESGVQSASRYVVRFQGGSVAQAFPRNRGYSRATRAQMQAYAARLRGNQDPMIASIRGEGGIVRNRLTHALNGVIVDLTPRQLARIQRMPGVVAVEPTGRFYMSQVGPPSVNQLIGAAPVHTGGNIGENVAIFYIDSGIDYMHASFGGPGTVAAYQAAVAGSGPTVIGDTAGYFPSGPKVVGGYDWLGETWNGSTNLVVAPDPDPIDNKQASTDFAGHGTHGASAAAGFAVTASLLPAGSAPGAKLVAYRACSRLSSSCEGSAILNSIESSVRYALGEPNFGQPGAQNPALPENTRFVLNMSLGAPFGNAAVNSTSEATRNAVRAGITVVASAGNSADVPFITGTAGSTDMVIGVAATEPASLTGPALTVGSSSYPLGTASFGPSLTAETPFTLAFAGLNDNGTAANLACSTTINQPNPFPPAQPIPDLTGLAGVADRGTCEFAEKAVNVQRAGAIAAFLVNNAAGAGTFGMALGTAGALVTIPTYSLGTADGAAVKAAMAAAPSKRVAATFRPLFQLPNTSGGINISDQIASFSSRGPSHGTGELKPDVSGPGVNIWMANVGTGNGGSPNSGTSFSTPLTSGVAALVLSANPSFTPEQVKAAIMNTADPLVYQSKSGNTLVPISRSGAGRIQANRAVATRTLAFDSEDVDPTPYVYRRASLSFGFPVIATPTTTLTRTVVVQNLGAAPKSYAISVQRRFADDAAKGVTIAPSVTNIVVPANSTATFDVTVSVNAAALSATKVTLANATNPAPLTDVEQDGYVVIDGGVDTDLVRVPYHVVPIRGSNVTTVQSRSSVAFNNTTGAGATNVDAFSLLGTDALDQIAPVPGSDAWRHDLKEFGIRYLPLAAGGQDVVQFAISLHRPTFFLNRPTALWVDIDNNNDGNRDLVVAALTNSTTAATNPSASLVYVLNNATAGSASFFTGMDVNSNVVTLSVLASALNLPNGPIGVRAYSGAFTGNVNTTIVYDRLPDSGGWVTITPSRLALTPSVFTASIAAGASASIGWTVNMNNRTASPGEQGALFFIQNNPRNATSAAYRLFR